MSANLVSIIIPARNEGNLLKTTIDSILGTLSRHRYEIIVVDDGSEDYSTRFLKLQGYQEITCIQSDGNGPAKARNLGSFAASGDVYIFCDAHIKVPADWLEQLISSLQKSEADIVCPGIGSFNPLHGAGYGFTLDQNFTVRWMKKSGFCEVPFSPGGCTAVSREVFDDLGGYEQKFPVYGYEDIEFSLKAWLYGFKVYVNPEVLVLHYFRETHPYTVDPCKHLYNLIYLAACHFNEARFQKILNHVRKYNHFSDTLDLLRHSDYREKRASHLKKRRFDDEWFMQKFAVPL